MQKRRRYGFTLTEMLTVSTVSVCDLLLTLATMSSAGNSSLQNSDRFGYELELYYAIKYPSKNIHAASYVIVKDAGALNKQANRPVLALYG